MGYRRKNDGKAYDRNFRDGARLFHHDGQATGYKQAQIRILLPSY